MQLREIKATYTSKQDMRSAPQINSSSSVVELLRPDWEGMELQETFKVIMLNRSNRVKGVYTVSTGGISGVVVDAKLVFAVALKCLASAMILCHNHPSGNRMPSEADNKMTRKIKQGAALLDIQVLDHVILTEYDYYSYADNGLIL